MFVCNNLPFKKFRMMQYSNHFSNISFNELLTVDINIFM